MRAILNLVSPLGRVGAVTYGIGMVVVPVAFRFAIEAWPDTFGWPIALGVYGFACLNANRLRALGKSQWWHLVPVVTWAFVFAIPIGLLQWFAWRTGAEPDDAPGTGLLAMMIAVVALAVSAGFALWLGWPRRARA